MYSINPNPMNTLITPDEVIRFFPGNSIDPNLFSSVIYGAEQRFCIPILGYAFYQQLCAQKNVLVTSANIATLQAYFTARNITLRLNDLVNAIDLATVAPANQILWNSVLWPFVAECVMFNAIAKNYAKFTSSGIIKNNPSPSIIDSSATAGTSAGISLNDLKYLRDNVLLQNISVMTDSLERYLVANYASYPLIPQDVCNRWCQDGKKQETRKTGFAFIYNDEDCDYDRFPSYAPPMPTPTPIPQTRACTLIINIVVSPDVSHVLLLCNLQTIPLEYPVLMTLTIPHLIGLTVNPVIQINNAMPFVCPYNAITGTFDNTLGGGFNDGDTVVINYNEVI